jgi:hypothetical protein
VHRIVAAEDQGAEVAVFLRAAVEIAITVLR